jgi:hypothetical protein
MAAQYPPIEALAQAYGLQALRRRVYAARQGEGIGQSSADFGEIDVEVVTRLDTGADDAQRLSLLGTPVFSDLRLQRDDADPGIVIDTVLFDVAMSRNIVVTPVQGRDGTVKEYISDGDYSVIIRGILVEPDPYAYPADQVRELLRLCEVKDSILAASPFLQLFRIYELVVLDYRLPQREGFQNTQLFELNCISETPIELIEEDV